MYVPLAGSEAEGETLSVAEIPLQVVSIDARGSWRLIMLGAALKDSYAFNKI